MYSSEKEISIIGAGISGISCAITLLKLGYKVTIYSKDQPLGPRISPSHVSLFPAASVIPHTVEHPNLNSIFSDSLTFFKKLFDSNFPGLAIHSHYEVFSTIEKAPVYKNLMDNFRFLDRKGFEIAPKHPKIILESGWQFDCYFADWGIYFPALIEKFKQLGGRFVFKNLDRKELKYLDSNVIINCAEIGGPLFTGEEFDPVIYRGHLIHIKNAPLITDTDDKVISFNFTPPIEYYQSENGNPQDLYFYPRQDGWILGGSRQIGTIDSSGKWVGENVIEPLLEEDGKIIPAQILRLHEEILQHSFGIDLTSFRDRAVKIGYRFMGNKKEGMRLDAEEKHGKLLIHNYGHGGAGVTLSWGCAFEVASLIHQHFKGKELILDKYVTEFDL